MGKQVALGLEAFTSSPEVHVYPEMSHPWNACALGSMDVSFLQYSASDQFISSLTVPAHRLTHRKGTFHHPALSSPVGRQVRQDSSPRLFSHPGWKPRHDRPRLGPGMCGWKPSCLQTPRGSQETSGTVLETETSRGSFPSRNQTSAPGTQPYTPRL